MSTWRLLEKHEQPAQCATQDCWGQPAFQFESGGVCSVYCRECADAIKAHLACIPRSKGMPLSTDERRLLRDFAVTGFQLLCDRAPDIVADLTRKGFLVWHWNGGIPVYEVTEAGRKAYSEGT